MRKNDYGPKTDHYTEQGDMYLPGSPDARSHGGDMYDRMGKTSGYGKKVETKKNKTGTGATNTGIQGSAARSKSGTTQNGSKSVSGTGRSHKSSYGTTVGNQLDNSPTQGESTDYGKGRNVTGSKRKHLKEQGA